jgi:hypothetical protein
LSGTGIEHFKKSRMALPDFCKKADQRYQTFLEMFARHGRTKKPGRDIFKKKG